MITSRTTFPEEIVAAMKRGHQDICRAFLANLLQLGLLLGGFWAMGTLMQGLAPKPIRGDFLTYLMSGLFLYQVHARALSDCWATRTTGAGELQIAAAALGALVMQGVSAVMILAAYDLWFDEMTIDELGWFCSLFLLAWGLGVGFGTVLIGVSRWHEGMGGLASQLYMRGSFVLSGQMFVANAMPPFMLVWFDWYPLFHMIDQARDASFVNYIARHSSTTYGAASACIALAIGYMALRSSRGTTALS